LKRVALLGEGLIELHGKVFGTLHQTIGGDTLNTAVYLARLTRATLEVQYLSAVGTDALSEGMLLRWQAEGIDTSGVLRDPARLPGLYQIRVDRNGERTFLYWRGESAARYLLRHPEFARVAAALARADAIYLSGISLAILPAQDRARLIELLLRLAAAGTPLIYDTNYRPALWQSVENTRAAMAALLPAIRIILTTFEDEQRLWGDGIPAAMLNRLHAGSTRMVVIKLGPAGCLYSDGTTPIKVQPNTVVPVVDTTAAGDAFNAAFIACWLAGCSPEECCQLGNSLAGTVIQHHGAIIPIEAMPELPVPLMGDEPMETCR
jgi:2-dehydro-3-deoxygluconokinase